MAKTRRSFCSPFAVPGAGPQDCFTCPKHSQRLQSCASDPVKTAAGSCQQPRRPCSPGGDPEPGACWPRRAHDIYMLARLPPQIAPFCGSGRPFRVRHGPFGPGLFAGRDASLSGILWHSCSDSSCQGTRRPTPRSVAVLEPKPNKWKAWQPLLSSSAQQPVNLQVLPLRFVSRSNRSLPDQNRRFLLPECQGPGKLATSLRGPGEHPRTPTFSKGATAVLIFRAPYAPSRSL